MNTHEVSGFEFVREIDWPGAFDIWRGNEADNPNWIALYRSRGFATWDAWRATYVGPLRLSERTWNVYRVTDPVATIPLFRGGPFRSWVETYYAGRAAPTFAELIEDPRFAGNPGIRTLMEGFPSPTSILAVLTDNGTVTVEGMHRCLALALAAREGKRLEGDLFVALGSALPGPLPVVGQRTGT